MSHSPILPRATWTNWGRRASISLFALLAGCGAGTVTGEQAAGGGAPGTAGSGGATGVINGGGSTGSAGGAAGTAGSGAANGGANAGADGGMALGGSPGGGMTSGAGGSPASGGSPGGAGGRLPDAGAPPDSGPVVVIPPISDTSSKLGISAAGSAYHVEGNIPYGSLTMQRLDVIYPNGAGPKGTMTLPGVIMFHGGGWIDNKPAALKASMSSFFNRFLAHGFVVCNVEYRLADGTADGATAPGICQRV